MTDLGLTQTLMTYFGLILDIRLVILFLLIVWNLIVFAVYGIDKLKSKKQQWRIPENTLIVIAFLFGGYGAWAAMSVFRHKTLHAKFRWLVPIAVFLETVILACMI